MINLNQGTEVVVIGLSHIIDREGIDLTVIDHIVEKVEVTAKATEDHILGELDLQEVVTVDTKGVLLIRKKSKK